MDSKLQVLYSAQQIEQRVTELGKQIDADYKDEPLVVVGVLKGSFLFMADLVRAIKKDVRCDFLRVSSYENDKSSGVVRMDFDLTQSIEGDNLLLIEDIVDTGRTLAFLKEHLHGKKPKSLKVCSLLYKDIGIDNRHLADYVGFEIPNHFVVGYGLDSEGLYRSLPYIGYFPR
ncbi:MAG: hypoxanthine phosphoribosyltransferase [Deltaproteobacteria bacterium CG11_big_fil_rev_8_21_14_0_20_47_16]|nr:MAG: hypoxanthine phosphoribosyltransferase [Deltaproteobacteria bacterium CG11_big_fil_rev_8_21_14_0_20_47_16]